MKKILIIGAGFSGLSAAKALSRQKSEVDVTIIDKKQSFDFLPVLPDCLGRRVDPGCLAYPLSEAAKKLKFTYINEEVTSVDLENRKVSTLKQELTYDYLIIASGTETNFYDNENLENNAFKVDSVQDISVLLSVLKNKNFNNYLICGGGYTGVELATNLRKFLRGNRKKDKRIILVERAPSILGPLPEWMKKYTLENLRRLNIEIFTGTSVERSELGGVALYGGRIFENSLLIWAAGVKTASFIQKIDADKNPQGRLNVNSHLRLRQNCFVIGDAAYFAVKQSYLRMAVQFSIYEGALAGENVLRSIKGKELKDYRPLDLGYIIPMANNRSCGLVLGMKLKGFIPTLMHFFMCIYRSYGARNKLRLFFNFLKGL